MQLTIFVFPTDGFFDSGLLTKSFHSQRENQDKGSHGRAASRREIGKRLRLNEY